MTEQIRRRPPIHKRKFLVEPKIQWVFVLQLLFLALITLGFFYYLEAHLMGQLAQIPDRFCQNDNLEACVYVASLQNKIHMLFLAKTGFVVVSLIVWGIYFSHRIAGPLVRLKRALRDYRDQKSVRPVLIRKNDLLHELADIINQITQKK